MDWCPWGTCVAAGKELGRALEAEMAHQAAAMHRPDSLPAANGTSLSPLLGACWIRRRVEADHVQPGALQGGSKQRRGSYSSAGGCPLRVVQ